MSQFYQPQPLNSLPRPMFELPAPGVQQMQIETPAMPGAVVAQDQSVAQLNGALSHFIGAGADLVNDRIVQRERATDRAERDAYRAEVAKQKADDAQWAGIKRGLATAVRTSLPGDEAAIKAGTLAPGESDQNDPEVWLDNLATRRLADVPEQFRDQAIDYYKSLWAPRGLHALYAKADADKKRADKITLDGFADEIIMHGVNGDTEAMDETLRREMPGIDPERVGDRVATTMVKLARDGHRDAVAGLKTWLGESYQNEQITAENMLEQFDLRVAREQVSVFKDEAAEVRKRVSDHDLTLEQGVREIEAAAKARKIGRDAIEGETRGLEAAILKRDAEANQRNFAEEVGRMKRENIGGIIDQAVTLNQRVTFANRVIGIDADGNEIVHTEAEQKKETIDALRYVSHWPVLDNGSPDPLGWFKMDAEDKDLYLAGLEKTGLTDPFTLSIARGMDLRSEDQASATKNDIAAVDFMRQVFAVSPVYGKQLVDAGGIEAKYAYMASLMLNGNPDTQAAIVRTKQLYKEVGDRIDRAVPSQFKDILDVEPSLSGNIPLLMAVANESNIRIVGMKGDADQAKRAAITEAIAAVRPFTLDVNGHTVHAGVFASHREYDREAASSAMNEMLRKKVGEISKADANQSSKLADYTLEMVNAELYRVVNVNSPTDALPRGVDAMIRTSDIEALVAQRMAEGFGRETRSVAELEKMIASAQARNDKSKADMKARAELVNADVRFQSGVGRMLPVQSFIDIAALEQELNVARVLERQKKK